MTAPTVSGIKKVEREIFAQADRAIAHILGVKDGIAYLTDDDAAHLRSAVLKEVNQLAEHAVELLNATVSSVGDPDIDDEVLRLLRELHADRFGD